MYSSGGISEVDPGGQLQWLREVLQQARTSGEKAYVLGRYIILYQLHITSLHLMLLMKSSPPGFDDVSFHLAYHLRFNDALLRVISGFGDVIRAHFYSQNSHTDGFRLLDGASQVAFLTPGLSLWCALSCCLTCPETDCDAGLHLVRLSLASWLLTHV
jgi:hypothetical protein